VRLGGVKRTAYAVVEALMRGVVRPVYARQSPNGDAWSNCSGISGWSYLHSVYIFYISSTHSVALYKGQCLYPALLKKKKTFTCSIIACGLNYSTAEAKKASLQAALCIT
jgi:hypothetical protein